MYLSNITIAFLLAEKKNWIIIQILKCHTGMREQFLQLTNYLHT